MVEKIVQVEADIQDKEETGVESALYIFGPSLMSEEVGFGRLRSPWIQTPAPLLLDSAQYARNTANRRRIVAFLCTSRLPEETREKRADDDLRGCIGGRWAGTRLPRPWEVA